MQVVVHVVVAYRAVGRIDEQRRIDVEECRVRRSIKSLRQQRIGGRNLLSYWVRILTSRRYALHNSTPSTQTGLLTQTTESRSQTQPLH